MTFDEFEDLDPRCLRVLKQMGIETPTPVQEQALPILMKGKDLIATAQTGTGKTLAFSLPTLSRLAREKERKNRMLVLLPTRELAIQVESVVSVLCKALHMHTALIYGGVAFGPQISALKRGSDVIVATPGRLLDHMSRGAINFKDLEVLCFDEADRMLDMGFLPDINRILYKLPKARQTLMFSATFAPELQRLTRNMMRDPERIEVGTISMPVDAVRQLVVPVRQEEKSRILLDILEEEKVDSAIIFLRTKVRTERVAKLLKKSGYKAAAIHGDLSQKLRQRSLDGFRDGRYNILVATDVAARGLDISDISHVINYDIPENPDDYVHRIGRTARAEQDGDAITFVTPTDHAALGGIEQTIGKNIDRKEYEGAPSVLTLWRPAGQKRKAGPGGRIRRARGLLRRR
ncbi:MAG: DEAD/DEAH box helicase [Candidatus Hydrogenedentes bacterium]|nr:DEAD/DEAH box helicase [Candidatus Hydrogenedentota bacterium]